MQTLSSDENSVRLSACLSVRLSVTRVDCDKTVERSVQIYIYTLFRQSEAAHNRYENDITDLN